MDNSNNTSFPVNVLPAKTKEMLLERVSKDKLNLEMSATSLLVSASVAIGNTYAIQSPNANFSVKANLFAVSVFYAGFNKSGSKKLGIDPISKISLRIIQEWKEDHARWEKNLAGIKDEQLRAEEYQKEPVCANPLHKNVTVESLYRVFNDTPRGILLWADEFSGFLGSFNQYNKGSGDLDTYCTIYDGTSLSTTRRGTGRSASFVEATNVFMSIIGTIQPSRAHLLFQDNLLNSGFTGRLLLCRPEDRRPPRRTRRQELQHNHVWTEIINALFNERLLFKDGKNTGEVELTSVSIDEQGATLFDDFCEQRVDMGYDLRIKEPGLSKYCMVTDVRLLKFILILHMIEVAEDDGLLIPNAEPIPKEVVQRAIELEKWYFSSWQRTYYAKYAPQNLLDKKQLEVFNHLPDDKVFTTANFLDACSKYGINHETGRKYIQFKRGKWHIVIDKLERGKFIKRKFDANVEDDAED